MPHIKLSDSIFRYKTHPLYLGVKKINKEIAIENLLLLKTYLENNEIPFGLIAGTLLGAIRENDFISHDEDIDLFFLEENKLDVLDLLPELKKVGFDVARYDRRGLLSIIRKGEYIDLYFFTTLCEKMRHCCGWCIPDFFLQETTTIIFKGYNFTVPKDYEGFLVYEYGYDWKTPIKWVEFDIPNWKRRVFELKEKIKEILPDFIFYSITKYSEKKLLNKYKKNIDRYNQIHNTSLKISNLN